MRSQATDRQADRQAARSPLHPRLWLAPCVAPRAWHLARWPSCPHGAPHLTPPSPPSWRSAACTRARFVVPPTHCFCPFRTLRRSQALQPAPAGADLPRVQCPARARLPWWAAPALTHADAVDPLLCILTPHLLASVTCAPLDSVKCGSGVVPAACRRVRRSRTASVAAAPLGRAQRAQHSAATPDQVTSAALHDPFVLWDRLVPRHVRAPYTVSR